MIALPSWVALQRNLTSRTLFVIFKLGKKITVNRLNEDSDKPSNGGNKQ